jgi:UrcA family protein
MPRYLNRKTAMKCTLLTMLLGSLSAVAKVEQLDEVPTRRVKFGDLDLSRSEGVAVLYARINSAAREVCLPVDNWMPKMLYRTDQCREEAIARAVADVDAPALTSFFLEKIKSTLEPR